MATHIYYKFNLKRIYFIFGRLESSGGNFAKFGGGASAEGTTFVGGSGGMPPPPIKFFKFGSLKWHLQHSERTFCKKFQVFKT